MLLLPAMQGAFSYASSYFYHIRSLRERGTATLPFPFSAATLLLLFTVATATSHRFCRRLAAAAARCRPPPRASRSAFLQIRQKRTEVQKNSAKTNLKFKKFNKNKI
ncbi:hypothetical protein [Methanimicrococcus stummii]|uniref:hypothetical protein n=1 Tax=Methanimicrococcus stummii TaxID=3028294 RepID=UPI00292F9146|nr:hypothetical protein [Methanimicrococcus sp. Es2]